MISIIMGPGEIVGNDSIIRECQKNLSSLFPVLHTGQHYSYQMDSIFFEQLELPRPQYNLDVGSAAHGEQTGRIMAGVEKVSSWI